MTDDHAVGQYVLEKRYAMITWDLSKEVWIEELPDRKILRLFICALFMVK